MWWMGSWPLWLQILYGVLMVVLIVYLVTMLWMFIRDRDK